MDLLITEGIGLKVKLFTSDKYKKKNTKNGWKRAVMTVEAAVIVPMSLTFIALLIGYCYFVHQVNWCKGAAYESVLCALQRERTADEAAQAVKERIDRRIAEAPLTTGGISTEVSSEGTVLVSWESTVLSEVFGDRFKFSGKASLVRLDAVGIKQVEHLTKSMIGNQRN